MNMKFSIIVPVYNAELYLRKCIESIISQTYENIEVICIDDGSKDDSLKILREYSEKDKRITVLSQENSGVSVARNMGIKTASGEYLMFVDSDDWIDSETCQVAFNTIKKTCGDVIFWDYVREFPDGPRIKHTFEKDIVFEENDVKRLHKRMIGLTGKELKDFSKFDALSTSCSRVYKTSLIKDNGISFYDIRKTGSFEDGIFNIELFEHVKKAVYINKPFYHYRKDNLSSVTTSYRADIIEKNENIHKYLKKYIDEKIKQSEYYDALQSRIASSLVSYGLNILRSNRNHYVQLKSILANPYYKTAFKKLEIKFLPLHWKIFYFFARNEFTPGVHILLFCIQKIIGR